MYLAFQYKTMSPGQITDYVTRVIQPQLQTIEGVSAAQILGGSNFAMRIWLDPNKMTAQGVTAADVATALRNNNFQTSAGAIEGAFVTTSVKAQTDLSSVAGFKQLIIKKDTQRVVRLSQVATVALGSESYDSSVVFNGKKGVFIGISATPTANSLNVTAAIRKMLPEIRQGLPNGFSMHLVHDATLYIHSAIREVVQTILEATLIVVLVIFLFMGSLRTVIIPVVTIPLSLVGVFSVMLMLGYSINLLTLLAMVLGIGLVVDDAIVMVENIYRHIEDGLSGPDAALLGAREMVGPVIAMTLTLAAVYAPIGFMTGLTGALFTEFAFTLAGTVVISGVIALTLSPMMCSRLLNRGISDQKMVKKVDAVFLRLKNGYRRQLEHSLAARVVILCMTALIVGSCFFLYQHAKHELAPQEDSGFVPVFGSGPEYANHAYLSKYSHALDALFQKIPERQDYLIINGAGSVSSLFSGLILKPWDQRKRSTMQIIKQMQVQVRQISGLQLQVFPMPALPTGSQGMPFQFVVTSTQPYQQFYPSVQKLLQAARDSGLFIVMNNSLLFNKPQYDIHINRSKAAMMGVSIPALGQVLSTALGGGFVNYFSMQGRSYKVIPQLLAQYRFNPKNLQLLTVRTASGKMVPVTSVVTIKQSSQPNVLTRFQQLNSMTLQGVLVPGQTLQDGLNFMVEKAKTILPAGVSYHYAGELRQFVQEGSALVVTLFFALIVIYLVLAALFESFKDPLITLVAVPLSIFGALVPLNLGFASVNIYTQIGLITLVGLISKHGILMVEFANQLQKEKNCSIAKAISEAASLRLRPILMTTVSMVVGVMPLILSSGAGAVSRSNLGLVIATGMTVGTLFTLFVVPTIYTLLASDHRPPQ